MQKILIIGDSADACFDMHDLIERQLPYHVFEAYDLATVKEQMLRKVFNIILIHQTSFDANSVAIVEYLKATGHTLPILIVAEKIKPEFQAKLDMLMEIHILLRPVLDKNIIGLMRKLMQSKGVPKQVYRRFNTNQVTEMEALGSGDSLLTSMYNLSKGGAYCEFESADRIIVGDLFRMKVFLNEAQKEYTFNAKVVWTTPKGRYSGRTGCGLKFVSSKDMYKSLLSKS